MYGHWKRKQYEKECHGDEVGATQKLYQHMKDTSAILSSRRVRLSLKPRSTITTGLNKVFKDYEELGLFKENAHKLKLRTIKQINAGYYDELKPSEDAETGRLPPQIPPPPSTPQMLSLFQSNPPL